MQLIFNKDNLHEMSNPVFWRKKNMYVINMSSTE